jgi:hypothetical protein
MTTQRTSKSEIEQRFQNLAYRKSTPFCLGCYVDAPSGICPTCHSDDLGRKSAGEGDVDWHCDFIIEELLRDNLTPVNIEESFAQTVADSYPETTKIGWLEYDTVTALRELDPVSWRCAQSEWESFEESEGTIISFDGGSSYYWTHEVEAYLDENESEEQSA